ncbi:hypothetical protein CONLIGDRAFT_682048 [Coniochaeta ligniaria NRRL 30616]|uniref:Histidine-specific methyltransferase SAM-dependent domain-containing protein n=1 Tax=Coniochaeta ligniaria NRRL 30616 TaxID=1408157 RepID=A0A1J7JN29_9PEZI|nr:hypothetical protein CONLIGDRAFT_682048 [Coniochaeta ligniaria NRRL 30616]
MSPAVDPIDVLDIRNGGNINPGKSLCDEVVDGLTALPKSQVVVEEGLPDILWNKSLPTVVLYQGHGIVLFEDITRDPKYYVYHEEMEILARHGSSIVEALTSGIAVDRTNYVISAKDSNNLCNVNLTLIDLGAGSLTKAESLLHSIEAANLRFSGPPKISSTYYAGPGSALQVDIQYHQLRDRLHGLLERNPSFLSGHRLPHGEHGGDGIAIRGVCGSYFDSLSRLQKGEFQCGESNMDTVPSRKCLMWLGSSVTNMEPAEAIAFLRNLATSGLQDDNMLLIGVDHCRDTDKIKAAYSETSGRWKAYVRNGIRNAGVLLGRHGAPLTAGAERWELVTRWDKENGRHMRFVRCPEKLSFSTKTGRIEIDKNEHVFVAQSFKYSPNHIKDCFNKAGLHIVNRWSLDQGDCSLYLLQRSG